MIYGSGADHWWQIDGSSSLSLSQAIKIPFFDTTAEPYSEYKIWIKAYTVKNEGKSSEPIVVMTDIVAPGQPIVVNLTCQNGHTIFLKWLRPTLFHRTVDVYNVHYRPEDQEKWEIQVVETVNNTINHMVIPFDLFSELCIPWL